MQKRIARENNVINKLLFPTRNCSLTSIASTVLFDLALRLKVSRYQIFITCVDHTSDIAKQFHKTTLQALIRQ